jgi:YD repeat-containing protein
MGVPTENLIGGSITSNYNGVREYDLNQLGNWDGFKVDATDGSNWDFMQERTHNDVNEHTGYESGESEGWADPVYDLAGNMTAAPVPGDEENSYTLKYDAWNRLVSVHDGTNYVEEYVYDALGRRVERTVHDDAATYDYYYNSGWQMVQVDKTPNGQSTHLYTRISQMRMTVHV